MRLRGEWRARQCGRALSGLILFLLVAAALYLLRDHWMAWLPPAWRAEWMPATVARSPEASSEPARIYVWQNDAGQWQYTDQPPTDRPFEVRQYREDTNVVPAFERPQD